MRNVIKPLGGLVTRLPIGPAFPGRTAGPTFELFYDTDYLIPHRRSAWIVMEERMRTVAELAVRCQEACSPLYMPIVSRVADALREEADRLAEAR
jgi:hypothetical protein